MSDDEKVRAAKVERLRAALQLGIDELDRGEFTEFDDADEMLASVDE
jgi:hypothetical protein